MLLQASVVLCHSDSMITSTFHAGQLNRPLDYVLMCFHPVPKIHIDSFNYKGK